MLYTLEGNIGAGKSTLLKRIARTFNKSHIYPEKVEEWTCVHGYKNDYNMLDLGKNESKQYAFLLQLPTLESHRNTLKEINNKPGNHFCERSQCSCQNVFTRYCIENNTMTDCQTAVYDNMVYNMRKPDHILYLNTPPDICLKRIRIRDRPEEYQLDIEYLNVLHRYHQEWLSNEEIPTTILHYENNLEHIMDTIHTVLSLHDC